MLLYSEFCTQSCNKDLRRLYETCLLAPKAREKHDVLWCLMMSLVSVWFHSDSKLCHKNWTQRSKFAALQQETPPKHGGKHGGYMLDCRGHGMILQVLQARPVQPEEKKGPRDGAFLTWLRGLSEMKSWNPRWFLCNPGPRYIDFGHMLTGWFNFFGTNIFMQTIDMGGITMMGPPTRLDCPSQWWQSCLDDLTPSQVHDLNKIAPISM